MKTKLLFIVMVFHAFNLSAAISSLSGNGTTTDPYLIFSVEELKWMRDQVNDKDHADYARATYKLMADLDFADENDWSPIGGEEIPFKGVFHGNDKTIKNIKIGSEDNPVEIHSACLFGRTENATIENIGVEWGGIYSYYKVDSHSYSGGIVGYMEGGSINNSHTTGDISSSSSHSGGIVGYMEEGNISNCHSAGMVYSSNSTNWSYSGGIIGFMSNGTISNSYSTGDISNTYAGGIVGYIAAGTILNSYSTGNITASSSYFYSGGIVGYMSNGIILNSYSSGTITSSSSSCISPFSQSYSGGIAGYFGAGTIRNCVALNNFIYAINNYKTRCFAGRILGEPIQDITYVKIENSYASPDMVVAIGTSSQELTPVTDFSEDNNGEELNDEPITVLNNYLTSNPYSDKGILYYSWIVDKDVNQGNPVLDYSSPAIEFTLEGNGSETNPFLIYTNEDLIRVTVFVNSFPNEYSKKFYKLMADLDFTGENDWIPIGRKTPFEGVFDGNGKTIKNIKIGSEDNPANMNSASLFGYLQNATIENLGVEWKGLYSSDCLGGIAGSMNSSTIRNSYSSGIISGYSSGGIVGYMSAGTISDSYSTANITASKTYCGGIVADMESGNISNSYSSGTITASSFSKSYAGGIVGNMNIGNISNSYSSGNISATNVGYSENPYNPFYAYSGGIVGNLSNGSICNSYSSGNISASNSGESYYPCYAYSGGIAGCMNSDSGCGSISNTYATGKIYSSNSGNANFHSYSGGIVGYTLSGNVSNNIALNSFIYAFNSQIDKCFVGKITGSSDTKIDSNYASNDIVLAIGISSDQLTPVTDFSGDKNGEELNNEPITVLNNYVTSKKCSNTGALLYSWIVENEVNQGNPILDYSSPTMEFTLAGTGSQTDPFLIYTNEDLIKVSVFVNTYPNEYSNKFYKLMVDLDFTGENDWTPIGIYAPFKGVFNGNDKTIKNIKIGSEDKYAAMIDWTGFLGWTENAIIENLGVVWSGLYSYSSYSGGIVCYMNNGTIRNSYSAGNIYCSYDSDSDSESYCGGLVGFMHINSENGSIQDSYSSANIYSSSESGSYCGGIVGHIDNNGTYRASIQNCYSSGNISASSASISLSGGIIGCMYCDKGIISNSYSSGDISASSLSESYSGGIVAYMESHNGIISNSYSSGNISASSLSKSYSGGIVGVLHNNGAVSSCISLNPSITSICIESKDDAFAGRVAGHIQEGTLSSNHAAENVSVKTGTSESDLSAIDPVGENHGDNLNDTPLNLLNNWVTNNTTPETPYLTWYVLENVNNGNPVFAALTILTVTFQTTEAMPETSVQAKYGALLTKPIDPVCEGFDFAGWHKDPEYKQPWDFDTDRVYGHTTLYAKWDISDSIEELNSDHLVIYSGTGEIVVKNAASGITIYNTAGALIKTIQQPGSVEHIGVEAGYYILKTDGVSKKVIVY